MLNSQIKRFARFGINSKINDLLDKRHSRLKMFNSAEKSTDAASNSYGFATNAIRLGQDPEKWDSRCVVPPLVLSSIFKHITPGECHLDYNYSRDSNPTRNTLEECLAGMEKAKYCLTFGSGNAAICSLSFLLKAGDHVVMLDNVYGGTNVLFRNYLSDFAIETTFVNMLDLNETERAFKQNTKMVWIDTPSNPLLRIVDIRAICEMARKKNPNIIAVVDNTFATSYFQNPIELGAEIVVMSLTKYMNGHTDVVMGALMLNDETKFKRLKGAQALAGAVPSPFDCYLVLRGLKTLELRMKQHSANGLAVARALEKDPRIERVIHPALESHPQHELFKRQMRGFGGIVTLYLKGGKEETLNFVKALKVFTMAASFGACESLVDIP